MEDIKQYIKKSFELKNSKLYKEAIELLYKALSIEPENIEIIAQIGDLYMFLKNFDRAIEQYEKVLDIEPKHSHSAMSICEIYKLQKNYEGAQIIAKELCKNSYEPKNYVNWFSILINLKNYEEVKTVFKELNEEALKDDQIYYYLAIAYLRSDEKALAQKYFEKSYELNSFNKKAIYELAKIYYENKAYEKAKDLFYKLKENAKAYNFLGLIELDSNNIDSSIEHFYKAQKILPNDAEISYNLGSSYALKGWLDEAQKFFTLALLFEENNDIYRYALAEACYQKGEFNKAYDALRLYQGELLEAHVLRALCLKKMGNLNQAKYELEILYKKTQDNKFLTSSLAQIYNELGNKEAAFETYKSLLQICENSSYELNNFISVAIDLKEYDKAKEVIQKILDKHPNSFDAYNSLARISYRLKEYEKTLNYLDLALKLFENYAEGYYFKGLVFNDMNQPKEAVLCLKSAITLEPSSAKYYAQIALAYKKLENCFDAFLYYKEAALLEPENIIYAKEASYCAKMINDSENEKIFENIASRAQKVLSDRSRLGI